MLEQKEADILINKIKGLKNIKDDLEKGNEYAIKLYQAYDFWYKCPSDAMAFVLCEEAYKEYVKQEEVMR
jgi:hypothetical protein